MVSILSLWLPIVLSAVFVFIVSSIIHMVLTYHRSDFAPVPDEDAVMDALRPFNLPQGEYVMPFAKSSKEMSEPEFKARMERGPVAFLTVLSTDFQMGKSLALWFLYCVLIGAFAAYLAGRALGPGAQYLVAQRIAHPGLQSAPVFLECRTAPRQLLLDLATDPLAVPESVSTLTRLQCI